MPTTVQRSDDNTLPLEQENRRLRRALEEMDVLEQIAAATSSDQPPDAIIELIVEKSLECLAVEQAAVHLLDEGPGERPLRTLMRRAGTRAASTSHALGSQISGWMLKHQQPLRINDPDADPRLRLPASPDAPIRSLLSVPVRSKGKLLGVLSLFNKKSDEGFTAEDERVLSIVAAHSAQALQSAKRIGELRHDRDQLANENTQLWREVNRQFKTDNVIGSATNLRKVLRLIEQIRDTSVDVLITGESGTGKELIAKTIHYTSPRARKPFVALNCAALPDTLLEAELFGIEKGVATGVEKRMGQFEAAHGGTLFLDEIGDLSLTAQAKILRVLQERVVQRLGARGEQRRVRLGLHGLIGAARRARGAAHRRARLGGDQQRPRDRHQGREVSRRPAVPLERHPYRTAAAARNPGGHPRAGQRLPRPLLPRDEQTGHDVLTGCDRIAHGGAVARQYSPVAERGKARGHLRR